MGKSANLLAINHWPEAIATHALNHPGVRHLCQSLDSIDPRKLHPRGHLDLMLASPECTHFSKSRGGKPKSDQSRASGWKVVDWASALRVEHIIVENVPEFVTWGPLDDKGKPIPAKKGQIFNAWLNALDSLGYHLDHRILNAADYGAPTSRERFFLQASLRRRPVWPTKTHFARPEEGQSGYRGAREIIDTSLKGESIFGRKKPLVPNTMKRIMAGLKKFNGCEFVLGQHSCSAPRGLGEPLPTIATAGAIALYEPFLVVMRNNCFAESLDSPLPTLTGSRGHFALVEPYLVKYHGDHKGRNDGANRAYSLDDPLQTLDTSNRFALCHPEPITLFERDGVTYALMDVRMRWLEPHECAAAMGMGGYQWPDKVLQLKTRKKVVPMSKTEKLKMIGNAVSVEVARALCREVLQ